VSIFAQPELSSRFTKTVDPCKNKGLEARDFSGIRLAEFREFRSLEYEKNRYGYQAFDPCRSR
jgi:hypothetical protein